MKCLFSQRLGKHVYLNGTSAVKAVQDFLAMMTEKSAPPLEPALHSPLHMQKQILLSGEAGLSGLEYPAIVSTSVQLYQICCDHTLITRGAVSLAALITLPANLVPSPSCCEACVAMVPTPWASLIPDPTTLPILAWVSCSIQSKDFITI